MRPLAIISRSLSTYLVVCALLAPFAAMAEPTGVAWSTAEDTSIPDLSVSDDGVFVAFVADGSSNVRFLDLGSWDVVGDTAACGYSTVGGVAITGSDGAYEVYVGCGDGTLVALSMDEDGETTELYNEPLALTDATAVLGVATDGSDLYAIAEIEDGNPKVHLVDLSTYIEDTDDYPSQFGQPGFSDTWLTSSYLYVSHGGQKVSKVQLSSGSIASSTENLSGRTMTDMYGLSSDSAVFLADEDGGVIRFNPAGLDFDILLDDEDGLDSLQAIAIDEDEGWLAVYDAGAGEVVVFSYSSLAPGDEEQARFETADILEMVVTDGYAIAGGSDGTLQVLTDRPWVEISSITPTSAVSGDEITVSFSADVDGTWELYLGGGVDGDGDLLSSGDCSVDATVAATFTVDDSFAEASNQLWLLVTSGGLEGHDRVSLTVDNPPSKVQLQDGDVGFGNQQISIGYDGIEDEDLASYTIFVTVTEFSADDWETGGPDFDGDDEVEEDLPLSITAEAGNHVSVTVQPLTNGVTYYVAVRAYDEGGQEGEMSNVVTATPQDTIGAAELAGETGGYCGTRTPWGLAALGLAGLLVAGRGRRSAAILGLFLALVATPTALAKDEEPHPRANADFEMRYGPYFPSSAAVTSVYGDSGHAVLWLDGGIKITRFAELDLGVGFYQSLSTLVAINDVDSHSAEHTMLTAWPFTGGLTARVDIAKEQLIVPTASIGMDYWLWRENWYVSSSTGGDSEVSGGELGWHWGLGVNLLLDRIEPSRADWLTTSMGIDDTYIVVDWRMQELGAFGTGDGVSLFDGSMVTIGLKIDM